MNWGDGNKRRAAQRQGSGAALCLADPRGYEQGAGGSSSVQSPDQARDQGGTTPRAPGRQRSGEGMRYGCRGRLWPTNTSSALPLLPLVLPTPTQTADHRALFSPQKPSPSGCITRSGSRLCFDGTTKPLLRERGRSQPRRGPRRLPSPADSRGVMGSLLSRSLESKHSGCQQLAAVRSLRCLCHRLGSLQHRPGGPGRNQEHPAWLLCCFHTGSQPTSFTLIY